MNDGRIKKGQRLSPATEFKPGQLLAIIFHVAGYWGPYAGNPNVPRFNAVWLFILFFLLGWAVFGFAIQGPGVR